MLSLQNMKKKRSLTLLEVILATVLLGFLLTGLFFAFRQGLKKNIAARELKQKILQLELFQQKIKSIFASGDSVWMEKHPDASSLGLFVAYEVLVDSDLSLCGQLKGMFFLNARKELCFVSWSENGGARIETLLDQVDTFSCLLFDAKKGTWEESWPQKKESTPVMAKIELTWKGKKTPYVFFLKKGTEPIAYAGPT